MYSVLVSDEGSVKSADGASLFHALFMACCYRELLSVIFTTCMGIIIWIVAGVLVGWVAALIMGADPKQGAMSNILVGTAGAVIGGFVMDYFGGSGISGFDLYAFLAAIFGAIVLLFIVQMFRTA